MKIIAMFILIFCRIDPDTLDQKILDFVKDVTFFRGSFREEVITYGTHSNKQNDTIKPYMAPTLNIPTPASTMDGGRDNELFGELGTQKG